MTQTTVRVQIQQRTDTAANWTSANPTLLSGELGHESDTKKYKLGDGSTAWTSLDYANNITLLDENNLASNSNTAAPSQASVKAYADTKASKPATAGTVGVSEVVQVDANKDITGIRNLTITGDLQVNGSTVTLDTTNTKIADNLLELNSGASSNANDSGIIIERGSTGDNAIFAWDESADKFIVGTTTGTASSTGDITITAGTLVTGTVEDSKGNVRSIPRLDKTAAYTITAADAGKTITADGNITIPNSVMSEGDAVTIIADGSADITITQGSGLTMYNSADASTGNRTLALRGMATIWFKHTSYCYISGAGLS